MSPEISEFGRAPGRWLRVVLQRREPEHSVVGVWLARGWRELWKQPVVTLIAMMSIVYAIAWASTSHETSPSASSGLGSLSYDLAVALLAAWIFNLLVVVLPRVRQRLTMHQAAQGHVDRLVKPGMLMRQQILNGVIADTDDETTPTEAQTRRWAASIRWIDPSPDKTFYRIEPSGPFPTMVEGPLIWQEWFVAYITRADPARLALASYVPFFDVEMFKRVEAVAESVFAQQIHAAQGFPNMAGTLEQIAEPIHTYVLACQTLYNLIRRD